MRYDFGSDNTAGMAPAALQALIEANAGFARAYGADDITARAADQIRRRLDADAEIRFVFSGTAANAIALSMLAYPHEAVLAHHAAHVCTDETGAPGFFGQGVGLIGLPGLSGKIDQTALEAALDEPEVGHRQPPAALSPDPVHRIRHGLYRGRTAPPDRAGEGARVWRAHGRRAAGQCGGGGFDLTQIARLGVDVLVFGGAKAGGLCTEAIVMFDKSLARRIDNRLKQAGQTASKARFLAAPFLGMLESERLGGRRRPRQPDGAAAGRGDRDALALRPGPPGRGQRRVRADAGQGACSG